MTAELIDMQTGEVTGPGIRIEQVVVGDRARKDHGDLTGLMESIKEHGLLQPIGVVRGNQLLFGGRRLEACRRLGWDSIPMVDPHTRDDALSLLKAERDENTCRKDMTAEELVDLGARLEDMERPKAEERITEGGRRGAESRWNGPSPAGLSPSSAETKPYRDSNDEVGDALGVSRNTYKRMRHVVNTSRDEDAIPEVQQAAKDSLADLNAGNTTPTAADRQVREARKQTQPAESKPATPKKGLNPRNRRKHHQVIDQIAISMSGLAIAADDITELDQSVTAEEAARLKDDLSKSIKSINKINTLLKERTK